MVDFKKSGNDRAAIFDLKMTSTWEWFMLYISANKPYIVVLGIFS